MRVLGLRSGHYYRAHHRPEALCFGAFWRLDPARGQQGGSAQGPNRGSVRDQASSNQSKALAAARGGAPADQPRWARILAITAGSSMAVMIVKGPPDLAAVFHIDLEHSFEQPGRKGAPHRGPLRGIGVDRHVRKARHTDVACLVLTGRKSVGSRGQCAGPAKQNPAPQRRARKARG
jgi:hypothetical protein